MNVKMCCGVRTPLCNYGPDVTPPTEQPGTMTSGRAGPGSAISVTLQHLRQDFTLHRGQMLAWSPKTSARLQLMGAVVCGNRQLATKTNDSPSLICSYSSKHQDRGSFCATQLVWFP
ncbi:hypothetical protein DPEC_G00160690 [Dallia pectoralis]|uniref:Uncharacterized protein n=1 Tax=Dallia pectoralis TaxID=75939 RepID=A0ACC2GG19_DALPE|nr:hypothetical protein DPEC_G00160690 [Dallia pectoralis]